jgi:hypothetical protein
MPHAIHAMLKETHFVGTTGVDKIGLLRITLILMCFSQFSFTLDNSAATEVSPT